MIFGAVCTYTHLVITDINIIHNVIADHNSSYASHSIPDFKTRLRSGWHWVDKQNEDISWEGLCGRGHTFFIGKLHSFKVYWEDLTKLSTSFAIYLVNFIFGDFLANFEMYSWTILSAVLACSHPFLRCVDAVATSLGPADKLKCCCQCLRL